MLVRIISYGHKDFDITPVRHVISKSLEIGKLVGVIEQNYRRVLFGNIIRQIVPDRQPIRLDDERMRAAEICKSAQSL